MAMALHDDLIPSTFSDGVGLDENGLITTIGYFFLLVVEIPWEKLVFWTDMDKWKEDADSQSHSHHIHCPLLFRSPELDPKIYTSNYAVFIFQCGNLSAIQTATHSEVDSSTPEEWKGLVT